MAIGAALGAAGVSAAASFLGGERANAASAKQSAEQRKWEERMYKNRHFYEVADLRKAGLNPILSAHGSPSTPTGASAQQKDTITPAISAAMTAAQMAMELKIKEQTKTNLELDADIKAFPAFTSRNLTTAAEMAKAAGGKQLGNSGQLQKPTPIFNDKIDPTNPSSVRQVLKSDIRNFLKKGDNLSSDIRSKLKALLKFLMSKSN